jgi:flagellar assembly factor FliW
MLTTQQAQAKNTPKVLDLVKTTRFGLVEIDNVITLPNGVYGFPELTKWTLIHHDEKSPFRWLQSIDDGQIAFVVIDSHYVAPKNYRENWQISDAGKIAFIIVTVTPKPSDMVMNLRAPVFVDLDQGTGEQVILQSKEYTTRHKLMDAVKRA